MFGVVVTLESIAFDVVRFERVTVDDVELERVMFEVVALESIASKLVGPGRVTFDVVGRERFTFDVVALENISFEAVGLENVILETRMLSELANRVFCALDVALNELETNDKKVDMIGASIVVVFELVVEVELLFGTPGKSILTLDMQVVEATAEVAFQLGLLSGSSLIFDDTGPEADEVKLVIVVPFGNVG